MKHSFSKVINSFIIILRKNNDWLTLSVSIIIAIATIITSVINRNLVNKQNKISLILMDLQERQNQPVFSISLHTEKDSDDEIKGTEILRISNVGHTTIQPCDVDADVYLMLEKSEGGQKDTLFFPIYDYFTYAVSGNTGDDEIYYAYGHGSLRKFAELYKATIGSMKTNDSTPYLG